MLLVDHSLTAALLEYRLQAHRTALFLLRDRDAAEDAVQDAFCRALAHADSYDRRFPLKPWFMRIVRNTCYSEMRRRMRRTVELPVSAPGQPIDAEITAAECAREVSTAMNRLRPAYRTAIELRAYGHTYNEIAESLRVPLGTAQTMLHRGRRELRSMLAL